MKIPKRGSDPPVFWDDVRRIPAPDFVRPTREEIMDVVVETSEPTLRLLAKEMRANSERWFPGWHGADAPVPLRVAWALGLAGEVGEVANVVKKLIRDGDSVEQEDALAAEMGDVFVYLLLLADECGVDLIAEYRAKVEINNARWGVRAGIADTPNEGGSR